MARIFRFSGYFVDNDKYPYEDWEFEDALLDRITIMVESYAVHQLHIEQGEDFVIDGELEENCDLALLTRHFKADNISTEFDRPLPRKGEEYKHFKIGKIVTIIGISRHTETEEISVVYEYEGHIWNRPLEMFMSEVDKKKYPDTKQRYRFERLSDVLVRERK